MNVENHVVPRAENTFSLIANAPFCGKSVEVYKIINIAKFILLLRWKMKKVSKDTNFEQERVLNFKPSRDITRLLNNLNTVDFGHEGLHLS